MTAQKRTSQRTSKRTNTAQVSEKPAASRAKPAAKTVTVRAPARAKSAVSGRRRAASGARPAAGERLRAELAKDGDPYGITVLINQAARVADRLEVLDRLLSGDDPTWLKIDGARVVEVTPKTVAVIVEVRVDNPILEERQQTTVFRHLLAQIHQQRANIPGGGDDDDDVMNGL